MSGRVHLAAVGGNPARRYPACGQHGRVRLTDHAALVTCHRCTVQLARHRRPDPDVAVGALLLDLADRMAAAWARGDEALAARWADAAFRIRGVGEFVDGAAPMRETPT